MTTRSFRCRLWLLSNLPYYYCTIDDSNTPQDVGSSKQKSPSGDKEQRTTEYAPGPGPDKPTTKYDVTCKSSIEYVNIVCGCCSLYSQAIDLFL